jgi:hypothetical protein
MVRSAPDIPALTLEMSFRDLGYLGQVRETFGGGRKWSGRHRIEGFFEG